MKQPHKPLVVIPTYVKKSEDAEVLRDAIRSAHEKATGEVDVLVVDDGSPEAHLVENLEEDFEFVGKSANTGFSSTVNVGLARALEEGRNAVLWNADLEMDTPGWDVVCRDLALDGGSAVTGGLLLYPQSGLIQHAGIYLSLLTRRFGEMYKFGPGNLPAALVQRAVPVTGAFQYIQHSTLETIGLYDEGFKLGWEDVDYCLRVFLAGQRCIYEPRVRAWHAESMFRGEKTEKIKRWETASFKHLADKYRDQNLAQFVPFW